MVIWIGGKSASADGEKNYRFHLSSSLIEIARINTHKLHKRVSSQKSQNKQFKVLIYKWVKNFWTDQGKSFLNDNLRPNGI